MERERGRSRPHAQRTTENLSCTQPSLSPSRGATARGEASKRTTAASSATSPGPTQSPHVQLSIPKQIAPAPGVRPSQPRSPKLLSTPSRSACAMPPQPSRLASTRSYHGLPFGQHRLTQWQRKHGEVPRRPVHSPLPLSPSSIGPRNWVGPTSSRTTNYVCRIQHFSPFHSPSTLPPRPAPPPGLKGSTLT
jgi:hypothetical protein